MNLYYKASYLVNYYGRVFRAPLNRGYFWRTLLLLMRWHIGSRLLGQPLIYPFVNNLRIHVATGMYGATGVVYFGLEEYSDMSFCAHLLRPDDTFVDVGTCFGTFTMLASGVAGARSIAFEPNSDTAAQLEDNLRLNRIEKLVEIKIKAVGARAGKVLMTNDMRGGNHVIFAGDPIGGSTREVQVTTLDAELRGVQPTLIKIDVEGYEPDVLEGGESIFRDPTLMAVIMEDVGAASHYRSVTNQHQRMLEFGFRSYRYLPDKRELQDLDGKPDHSGQNTIYLRSQEWAIARLRSASPIKVRDRSI